MAILGLPPTDDDAETAIDRNNERPEPSMEQPEDLPTIPKSSAFLKKVGAWGKLTSELEQDMLDVRSLVALERVKVIYRQRAKEEGWNAAFKEALKNEFLQYEDRIKRENSTDAVDDILDTFPGSKIVNDRFVSTLEAGE